MASKKANVFGYINALFNPNIAIRDGKYVHANGLFDSGADGLTLSDNEVERLNKHSKLYNVHPLYALYSTLVSPFGASPVQDIYDKNVKTIDDLNDMRSNNIYTEKTTGDPYSRLTGEALDFWQNLSENERQTFLHNYDESFTTDEIIADLMAINNVGAMPIMPEDTRWTSEEIQDYIRSGGDSFYNAAASRLQDSRDMQVQAANEAYAQLESDLGLMSSIFNRQKEALSDAFEQSSSNLRSQQYLANAQTYDALRSDLRRSRQNALEAGASAGVRIASNVNALLTAQNKQSATSMDTANALAEMLLQHRNSMTGLTRDYANYRTNAHNAMATYNQRAADAQANYDIGMTDLENDTATRIGNQQQRDYDIADEKYIRKMNAYEKATANSTNPAIRAYATKQYEKAYKT